MKKITKYITKEQLYPFLTGFIFFTFILMLQHFFSLADLLINKDVNVFLVLKLFLILLPITMSLTIPMSLLFSSIMALARLSGDSEVTALRASGVSIYRIIKPIIMSGIMIFVLMLIFTETVLVYCNKNYNKIFVTIMKSSPTAMLEDGIFISIGDKTIWVEKINKKNGRLNNIMIYNKNNNIGWDIIKAKYGNLKQNEDGSKTLKLNSGKLFSSDLTVNSFSVIDFSNGNLELLLSESKIEYNVADRTNPSEMNSIELYRMLKSSKVNKNERKVALFWVELFKKISIPFSCLVFVFIGAPVGISYRRSARGIGFGISIIIFFVYYIFSMLGQSLAIKGAVSPFLGVWYPNFILLIAGIILIFFKEKA
ncbi:MAG: LptF/LptG family permease [Spirochaetes bacterium]|nr:LptF/LptG family permease [Spirochaetota bacterium]